MKVAEALARMRTFPVRDIDEIVGDGSVVILAPHPDDESLGCGGLIAELCARWRPPKVIFITDGTGSHPNSRLFPPDRLRTTRAMEARSALRELGVPAEHAAFLGLPDTAAPHAGASFDDAVEQIADILEHRKYGTVFAPWRNDPHGDHVATHRMAVAVARRLRARHLSYPVWGWTLPLQETVDGGVRGARLDISGHLTVKRRAIAAHASQLGELITDDPAGFHLREEMIALFQLPFEVYLDNADT